MSELLEKILSRENMTEAFKRVSCNKGSDGTDGVSIEEAEAYVRDNWAGIKKQVQQRQYRPQPVRRVEIPKPNGGKRKLGIPQGGNLSPLLSNIMLNELDNELDKELDARGLRFTRYADDCVIVVKSESSAKRVMRTITDYIERKLGLKVNATKTHVTRPNDLKYLGFGFWKGTGKWQAKPHKDSVTKFQRKLKQLCERRWNIPVDQRIIKLNQVIRGWINYFSVGSMKSVLTRIDAHLRTMIRVIIWKPWKKPSKRLWGLRKLGVPVWIAERESQWGDHYQFIATKSSLGRAVSKQVLSKKGLVSCLDYYLERHDLKFS